MKAYQWLGAGLALVAVAAGANYAYKRSQPRVITVGLYSDYSFRLQHSNWSDLLVSRLRDANLIFQQSATGVQYKVLGSSELDPTSNMANLDGRRGVLPDQAETKADVVVSITGMHEGDRIGSTNPFSRGAMVVDFPDRSEAANAVILAVDLAHMFAAPIDTAWVQTASAAGPQSTRFPAKVSVLIHQLRRYNFAAGVDGLLQGSWAKDAAAAIAEADTTPNTNHAARAEQVIGIALLNDRRRDAAVIHLREASRLDPKSIGFHVETALALSRNGQDDDALKEVRDAIKLEPNNAFLHMSLGSLLVKVHRPEEALAELTTAAKLDPKSANVQVALATAYSQQLGRYDAANAALHEALRLDPTSAAAIRDLQQIADNRKVLEEEIAKRRARLQQVPNDYDAHYRLGMAIASSGDLQGGLRELQKAIEIQRNYGPAHAESAAIYFELGDYSAAWREVKQARAAGTEPPSGLVAGLTQKMPEPK